MSSISAKDRKAQLLEMERALKKKIQSETDSVEKSAISALKVGLVIGGALFAGYQVTRLLTSSKKDDALKKKVLTSL
jgi:hypothetical protein